MKKVLLFCLFSTVVFAETPAPFIIAHRGASGYLPEHTFAAKALAFGQGAHYLEQDLVLTQDDIPVVLHDIHIDTISDVMEKFPGRQRQDGRFYALDFTLAELKMLTLSERFNAKTGRQVYPKRFPKQTGTFRIVSFEEELIFIAGLNHSTGRTAGIYPEIKKPDWHREQGRDLSRPVLELLHQYGYQTKDDPCYIQCFDHSEILRLRNELGWKGRLMQIASPRGKGPGSDYEYLRSPAGLAELAKVADAVSIEVLDGEGRPVDTVKVAQAAGLKVISGVLRRDDLPPYVQSAEELLQGWQAAGIDGYFTDFPDVRSQR